MTDKLKMVGSRFLSMLGFKGVDFDFDEYEISVKKKKPTSGDKKDPEGDKEPKN